MVRADTLIPRLDRLSLGQSTTSLYFTVRLLAAVLFLMDLVVRLWPILRRHGRILSQDWWLHHQANQSLLVRSLLFLMPFQLDVIIQVPGDQPIQLIISKAHAAPAQYYAEQYNQTEPKWASLHRMTTLFTPAPGWSVNWWRLPRLYQMDWP